MLDVQLSDTMRAHIQHDGVYTKDRRGKKNLTVRNIVWNRLLNVQTRLLKKTSRVFIPKMKPEEE